MKKNSDVTMITGNFENIDDDDLMLNHTSHVLKGVPNRASEKAKNSLHNMCSNAEKMARWK
jgi:hypothetical protein